MHGSAALGALLVMTLGVVELVRSRGGSRLRSIALVALAPLALLLTPYGPVATAEYYHLLLVDPPFGDNITEWGRTDPDTNTFFFYVLTALTVVFVARGWRRLSLFDLTVLAITLANAFLAIRGVVWFSLAALVTVPVAMMKPADVKANATARRLNRILASGVAVAVSIAVVLALARDSDWYEQRWPDASLEAIREATADPSTTVFTTSHFSDWLLWKLPELRGRVAHDVRFEVYTPETFERILDFTGQRGDDWTAIAEDFDVIVLGAGDDSRIAELVREPGTTVAYRDDDAVIITRSPAS